jgi:hypothetical protein
MQPPLAIPTASDETNQNLTNPHRELLLWHQKLGHAGFAWIQKLARKPKDEISTKPILEPKHPTMTSCMPPLVHAACHLARPNRRRAPGEVRTADPNRDTLLRQGDLKPGDCVSLDQYVSALPGRLLKGYGKEKKKDKYSGGTLFVNHASSLMYLRHQVSLRTSEMIKAKRSFEQFASSQGVTIKNYQADNFPFGSAEFRAHIDAESQEIRFSGVGAHHQNGVAECGIMTVTTWARCMMLHAVIHWPDQANLELWSFALDYAVYLWNNLPKRDNLLAPLEVFSATKFTNYSKLNRAHVSGCPVYVLEPKLQDGKKVSKWAPRARRGCFLGFSSEHSSTVGKILNLGTGYVSPQYHVVHHDKFPTAVSAEGEELQEETFDADSWV